MNQEWHVVNNLSLYFICIFLCFFLMSFSSVLRFHPGHHTAFSHHIIFSSSWLWQCDFPSCFWWSWWIVKSTNQVFVQSPHFGDFLMIRLGLWLMGEKVMWGQSASCHHIISEVHTSNMMLIVDVDFDLPGEVVLLRFVHCKGSLPPLLHTVPSGMKSPSTAWAYEWGVMSTLFEWPTLPRPRWRRKSQAAGNSQQSWERGWSLDLCGEQKDD